MSVITTSPAIVASTIWSKSSPSSSAPSPSPSHSSFPSKASSPAPGVYPSEYLLTKRAHADYCSTVSAFCRIVYAAAGRPSPAQCERLSHKYHTFLRIAYHTLQDQVHQLLTSDLLCPCEQCDDLRLLRADLEGSVVWIQQQTYVLHNLVAYLDAVVAPPLIIQQQQQQQHPET